MNPELVADYYQERHKAYDVARESLMKMTPDEKSYIKYLEDKIKSLEKENFYLKYPCRSDDVTEFKPLFPKLQFPHLKAGR